MLLDYNPVSSPVVSFLNYGLVKFRLGLAVVAFSETCCASGV